MTTFIETKSGDRVNADRVATITRCELQAHHEYADCWVLQDDKGRAMGHVTGHRVNELEKSARRVVPNTTGIKGAALLLDRVGDRVCGFWSEVPVVGWEIIEGADDALPTAIPVFADEAASNYFLFTVNPNGSLSEWCVWSGNTCTYDDREAAQADKIAARAAA